MRWQIFFWQFQDFPRFFVLFKRPFIWLWHVTRLPFRSRCDVWQEPMIEVQYSTRPELIHFSRSLVVRGAETFWFKYSILAKLATLGKSTLTSTDSPNCERLLHELIGLKSTPTTWADGPTGVASREEPVVLEKFCNWWTQGINNMSSFSSFRIGKESGKLWRRETSPRGLGMCLVNIEWLCNKILMRLQVHKIVHRTLILESMLPHPCTAFVNVIFPCQNMLWALICLCHSRVGNQRDGFENYITRHLAGTYGRYSRVRARHQIAFFLFCRR